MSTASDFAEARTGVQGIQVRKGRTGEWPQATRDLPLQPDASAFLASARSHVLSLILCENMALPKKLSARAIDRSEAKIKKSRN